jgi:hypothetical protein
MLFNIPADKHTKREIKEMLRSHPEIKFVSLVGLDIGGYDTDEKIPVEHFMDNMDNFLVKGVQTDGSSVVLPKIAAINNQVDSKFVETTGQIIFGVLIKGFKFENQLMEDHFNENYMESTQFPKADFKGYIKNIKDINFSKEGNYPIQIEGTLTIHGIPQKVSTNGTLQINEGKPAIVGEFSVKIKDYGIKGLYIGEKIANEAIIKVNCKYQN